MAPIMITAPRTPQTTPATGNDEDEDIDEATRELRGVAVLELRFGLGREFDPSGDVGVDEGIVVDEVRYDDIVVGCENDPVVWIEGVNAVAATVIQMISQVYQRLDTA